MKIKTMKVRSNKFRKNRKFMRGLKRFLIGGRIDDCVLWVMTSKIC
jgi:hypothetical protein